MILKDYEFTAIDLETTGLKPGQNEILEIAAIRFNKDKPLAEFHSFISPRKELKKDAQLVNGITKEMLENAPSLDKKLAEFFHFIENSMLVIQNADFDLSFLLFESKKLEIPFPNLPVLCTLNMTRSLFPNYPKHGLAHLRKYFKIDTIKTSDRTDFHQALDDSYAAMKVFIYSADKANLWEKDISILNYHPKGFKTSSDFEI